MADKKEYAVLWPVAKHLLTLSHGQADVEQGFSINKEAIRDNQNQKRPFVGELYSFQI